MNIEAYTFMTEDAVKYGVDMAILLHTIRYWIKKNEANNQNYHEGRYWTYNSKKAWATFFPFWTEKQVRRLLDKAVAEGILVTANYNENTYDRTLWYSFAEMGKCISPQRANGKAPEGLMEKPTEGQCLTYNNTNNNTIEIGEAQKQPLPIDNPSNPIITNLNASRIKHNPQRIEPQLEDILAYAAEQNSMASMGGFACSQLEATKFYCHYSATGWVKTGGGVITDWRVALRGWALQIDRFMTPEEKEESRLPKGPKTFEQMQEEMKRKKEVGIL